ncbi:MULTISPECIES: Rrf2 family transcriptional regulator [unclassified Nitratiruptor]|uniref:RrF2 family transcriptional regulator n=1 Tax=unclassified Nitratiruptor TaxID=2624044 RepID=UPI001915DB08|nr:MULTISPECIES: Rrf2 family transcriptional regulator [unclassified Nitratiruptor]BCD60515.1 transcriptional regulator, BadM/Rrf2 family [Nitratiruptor sp. YY08-10]BCD63996.1 transcriptional regulator, BadM/Rrf2 family [Nitratiruptor sp. YY08-14]
MALVSAKGSYAIAAIFVLYEHHNENKPLKTELIAKLGSIPKNFLEQILLDLKKSGIVQSIRGAKGGYILAKPPQDILLIDIINSVEPECCTGICRTRNPALEALWSDFNKTIHNFLARPITIFDEYSLKARSQIDYCI